MDAQKKHSFLDAKNKIEAWCAYRERCHSEVFKKLLEYGLDEEDTNALISHLIEYNFLNEQRFADSFVSGKFNIKKWGRNKIKAHLKQKNIPDKCILEALKEIDETAYYQQLLELAKNKWNNKKGNPFEKKIKVQLYLSGKGYEFDLIYQVLSEIEENQ